MKEQNTESESEFESKLIRNIYINVQAYRYNLKNLNFSGFLDAYFCYFRLDSSYIVLILITLSVVLCT